MKDYCQGSNIVVVEKIWCKKVNPIIRKIKFVAFIVGGKTYTKVSKVYWLFKCWLLEKSNLKTYLLKDLLPLSFPTDTPLVPNIPTRWSKLNNRQLKNENSVSTPPPSLLRHRLREILTFASAEAFSKSCQHNRVRPTCLGKVSPDGGSSKWSGFYYDLHRWKYLKEDIEGRLDTYNRT